MTATYFHNGNPVVAFQKGSNFFGYACRNTSVAKLIDVFHRKYSVCIDEKIILHGEKRRDILYLKKGGIAMHIDMTGGRTTCAAVVNSCGRYGKACR
jgi:hypothetical protein